METDEIGDIIKYHRKQSKLSRQELADLAGVGKTVIYDIEKGKKTIQLKSLLKVLEVLNIQLKLDAPFRCHERILFKSFKSKNGTIRLEKLS